MSIKFGNTNLSNVYLGDLMANKVYLGNNVIWEKGGSEVEVPLVIDFSQSTAPTLPSYMTVDGQGTYYFKHRQCISGMGWGYYGLASTNTNKSSTTAYTRYKYVAPKDGTLKFNYGCSSSDGDYFTIHVNTSNTQPSYDSATDRIVYASDVNDYYGNSTAKINVVENETYYIHVQYYKDSSGNGSYDCGFITKIELAELEEETYLIDYTQETAPILPSWFTEETKDATYYFEHGKDKNGSLYGLVANYKSSNNSYWSCYKLVAPITGALKFTFRTWTSTSRGFSIHVISDATQPVYYSSDGRIAYATGSTYNTVDGVAYLDIIQGETYYIHLQIGVLDATYAYANVRSIEILPPISSINGFEYDVDLTNIEQTSFTVSPIIKPSNYDTKDLEIIYDSNYMTINPTTYKIALRNGSQGMSHTVTYRSKADNSISKSFTFYVNENVEIADTLIDFTQSTAPTLPSYMTVDGTGTTYKFNHGLYTTDVYGLIPSNKGKNSSTAYTRYKYVAPKSGDLTFTYRCYAETKFDYLTVHVDTSTSQPSKTSATNQVFTTKGVSSYQNTDGTASISVVEGTTYYIHIQYSKDSSGNKGYDMGCIRKIELV